jgi:hypothetical protein
MRPIADIKADMLEQLRPLRGKCSEAVAKRRLDTFIGAVQKKARTVKNAPRGKNRKHALEKLAKKVSDALKAIDALPQPLAESLWIEASSQAIEASMPTREIARAFDNGLCDDVTLFERTFRAMAETLEGTAKENCRHPKNVNSRSLKEYCVTVALMALDELSKTAPSTTRDGPTDQLASLMHEAATGRGADLHFYCRLHLSV